MIDGYLVKGNYRPVRVFHNGKQIAGAKISESVTLPGTIGNTYNDTVYLNALGKGKQKSLDGKNKLPYPYSSGSKYSANGITFKSSSDGSVNVSGVSTGYAMYIFATNYTPEKNMSFGHQLTDSRLLFVASYYDSTGTKNWANSSSSVKLVAGQTYYQLYIQVNPNRDFTEPLTVYPQLEEGSSSTGYEVYCGGVPAPNRLYPINPDFSSGDVITSHEEDGSESSTVTLPTLCAVPDSAGGFYVRDELSQSVDGSYSLTSRVGVKAFDGTESWTMVSTDEDSGKSVFTLQTLSADMESGAVENGGAICTHYPHVEASSIDNGFFGTADGRSISIRDSFTSVDDFKAFLASANAASNPVKIWYPLQIPTVQTIALNEAKSYPHLTVIKADGSYPPDISAKAYVF